MANVSFDIATETDPVRVVPNDLIFVESKRVHRFATFGTTGACVRVAERFTLERQRDVGT